MPARQWRRKLKNFEGEGESFGDEKFGVKQALVSERILEKSDKAHDTGCLIFKTLWQLILVKFWKYNGMLFQQVSLLNFPALSKL